MTFLIFFMLVFVFLVPAGGNSLVSLLWAGYVNMHISIGWHRTKGAGRSSAKQTSSACV